jgi:hypothetical protein
LELLSKSVALQEEVRQLILLDACLNQKCNQCDLGIGLKQAPIMGIGIGSISNPIPVYWRTEIV